MKHIPFLIFYLLIDVHDGKKQERSKETRLAGGKPVGDLAYPFVASIQYRKRHWCSGSVISAQAILTAASCFAIGNGTFLPEADFEIGIGSSFWRYADRYQVEKIISHPQYDREKLIHDIAIVKTLGPMNLSSAEPVKVYASSTNDDIGPVDGVVLGWGYTSYAGVVQKMASEQLNSLLVKSIPLRICQMQYEGFGEGQICMSGAEGMGACSGDVGAPLLLQPSDDFLQIGVNSYGMCDSTKPDVYTRISAYYDWINVVIRKQIDPGFRASDKISASKKKKNDLGRSKEKD